MSVPAVKLIPVTTSAIVASPSASANESRTASAKRSHRGRTAQIATPTDIRWPVVQEYLRSSSLSPNSRKLYERELKRFLGWTQCRWSELQSRHLGLYKAYLMELEVASGKKLSKNSLNSALTALKSFFRWLCQFHPELCLKNPTEGVKFERVPMPPAQSLKPEEMERVWSAIAQRNETRLRDFAMVQLLSHNLRAGEVASANVGSFDGRLITLTETKNNKPRIVPLSEEGQLTIQNYLEWRRGQGEALTPESPLILSHHQGWEGDRLSYHGIYFAVERIGELAGLPDLHPHQFRHTGATELLRMGMDPAHAKLLTGHADERSFRRYVLAVEQEAAIAAYYRLKGEGQAEKVVYAKNLSREQRQLLMAMAELTQMQPLYQDDLDKGEITFAELWQENAIHLERMVAEVWQLPEKLGVLV
ncbi:tyrosine-type recombinase/integrase [Altericista sp. CCNU0014]|uniref:tyrosine-type recombinase/integrase n=1 Tax=Altericista sp. CCNU0014 TaxID=3082949 RepID=UPI00385178C5